MHAIASGGSCRNDTHNWPNSPSGLCITVADRSPEASHSIQTPIFPILPCLLPQIRASPIGGSCRPRLIVRTNFLKVSNVDSCATYSLPVSLTRSVSFCDVVRMGPPGPPRVHEARQQLSFSYIRWGLWFCRVPSAVPFRLTR